jgi:hypothetical protein
MDNTPSIPLAHINNALRQLQTQHLSASREIRENKVKVNELMRTGEECKTKLRGIENEYQQWLDAKKKLAGSGIIDGPTANGANAFAGDASAGDLGAEVHQPRVSSLADEALHMT